MGAFRSVLSLLLVFSAQLCLSADWTVSGMADLPVLDPTGRWATDLRGKTWPVGSYTLHPVRNQVFQTGGAEAPNGRFTLDGNAIVRAYPDRNFVRTIEMIDALTGIPRWTVLRPGTNKVIGMLDNGTEFVTQENVGTTVRSLLNGQIVRSFTFDSSVAFGHYSAVRDGGYRWIVYDLNDGSIKYQKQTSVDPRGSVFSESNRYLFHQWGQTQYLGEVLDLATGSTVPVPYRGSASAVSNDGQWVLQRDITALYWTNVVSQQTVALPWPIEPGEDAKFSHDASFVWIETDFGVMQYNLPTLQLSSLTGVRSADDPHLFSRSGSGNIYGAGGIFATYDGATGDITTAMIDKTKNYYAMSIGDKGGTLATLAVVNPTNADEIVELRPIGPGGSTGSFTIRLASDITVAKRSKHLYLALSSNRYQLRAFSGTIVASTTVTNTSSKPILAPDDSACFLPTSNSGNFVTSVLDGSSLALLRQDQGYCQGVSPDGRYSLNMRHPLGEIVLLDAKTGQLARVLEPTERAYLFASCGWSRDSKVVFHFLEADGVKTLAAWSTETGQRVWTDTGGRTGTWGVDVDPTGSRLAVSNSVEVSTMDNPVPMDLRGRPTALSTKIGTLQGRGLLDIQFQDFDTALFLAGPRTSLNGPSVVSDIDFKVGIGSSGPATFTVRTKASMPACQYEVLAFDWALNTFTQIGGGELPTTLSALSFNLSDLSPFVQPQGGTIKVQLKTFAPALSFTVFSQEIDETVWTFGE